MLFTTSPEDGVAVVEVRGGTSVMKTGPVGVRPAFAIASSPAGRTCARSGYASEFTRGASAVPRGSPPGHELRDPRWKAVRRTAGVALLAGARVDPLLLAGREPTKLPTVFGASFSNSLTTMFAAVVGTA